MASVRDIFVRLGVKTDPRGFKRAAAGISNLKRNAVLLAGAFVGVGIGFKKLIESASEIQETTNKFAAVFGEAGSDVQTQLNDIAKRTGATNLQLQQMSSNIGAIIKPALGSAAAAGKMSAQIAELAIDIGSFNNVAAEDALVALRSGLIGQSEPLQRFGVDVRVAAVELEAMRQGISTSTKEMTEGQKVTLRFAAIQRQLGVQGATGDATRTAKDFANASRNLGAAIKETAGIIGTFFLRSTGGMINRMRVLVDTFQQWLATNRELIQQRIDRFLDRASRIIGAVAAVIGRAISFTRQWANSLGPVATMFLKIATIAAGLAILLLLPGGALLLLAVLVGLLIEDFETWRKGGESVIGDLLKGFKELGVGFRLVSSLFIGLSIAVLAAFVKMKIGVIGAFLATKVAAIGAGLASAAAWIAATLPLILFTVLMGILIGAIIFVVRELIALGEEGDSFLGTMITGVQDLINRFGGISGAIKEMLKEALRFWFDFFGSSEKAADEWVAGLKSKVQSFFDFIRKNSGFGQFVAEGFGFGGGAAGGQRATASPSGTTASVTDNSSRNINVEVNAAPGMTTGDLAELVPREIRKAEDAMNRQGRRAFAESAP